MIFDAILVVSHLVALPNFFLGIDNCFLQLALESGSQRHTLAGAAGINRARIHTEREATFLREAGEEEIAALQRLDRLLDRFLRMTAHDVTFDVEPKTKFSICVQKTRFLNS